MISTSLTHTHCKNQ